MESMDQAYRRDNASKQAMDDLRRRIEVFLTADDPVRRRCKPKTEDALRDAVDLLQQDADHVVAVWN